MDNVEEYGELMKLLAKYKFNLYQEAAKDGECCYAEQITIVNNLINDIPIIIRGDED